MKTADDPFVLYCYYHRLEYLDKEKNHGAGLEPDAAAQSERRATLIPDNLFAMEKGSA